MSEANIFFLTPTPILKTVWKKEKDVCGFK